MNASSFPPADRKHRDPSDVPPVSGVTYTPALRLPQDCGVPVGSRNSHLNELAGSVSGSSPSSLRYVATSVAAQYVSPNDDDLPAYRGMEHCPADDGVASARAALHPGPDPDILQIPLEELRRHADYSHGQFVAQGSDRSSALVSLSSDPDVAFVFATKRCQRPGFVVHLRIPRHEYEALVVPSPGIYASQEKELLTVRILPHWIRRVEQVQPRHRP